MMQHPSSPLLILPRELISHVASYLPLRNLHMLAATCRYIHDILKNTPQFRRRLETFVERHVTLPPFITPDNPLLPLFAALIADDLKKGIEPKIDWREETLQDYGIERLIIHIPGEIQRRTIAGNSTNGFPYIDQVYQASYASDVPINSKEAESYFKPVICLRLTPFLRSLKELRFDITVPSAIYDCGVDKSTSKQFIFDTVNLQPDIGGPKASTDSDVPNWSLCSTQNKSVDVSHTIKWLLESLPLPDAIGSRKLRVQYRVRNIENTVSRVVSAYIFAANLKISSSFEYCGFSEFLSDVRLRPQIRKATPVRLRLRASGSQGSTPEYGDLCAKCTSSTLQSPGKELLSGSSGLGQFTLINRVSRSSSGIPLIPTSTAQTGAWENLDLFDELRDEEEETHYLFSPYAPITFRYPRPEALISRLSHLHLEGVCIGRFRRTTCTHLLNLLCPHTATLVLRDCKARLSDTARASLINSYGPYGLWNISFEKTTGTQRARHVEIIGLGDEVKEKYPRWLERMWEGWVKGVAASPEDFIKVRDFENWEWE